MSTSSLASTGRRPCDLRVDVDYEQRTAAISSASAVDRLLADIAFQRQRERRQRADSNGRRRTRRRYAAEGRLQATEKGVTSELDIDDDDDGEAASEYWWTDVFLRYFVFDEDCMKPRATVADSDDLLFFVRRRRRGKHKKRQIAYDTRAYRKQQQQHHTLLPIGDPAVMWRQTVCLNAIVHRLRYTLTVAVCVRVPRKSTAPVVSGVEYYDDENGDDVNDEPLNYNQEYDLQLVSRHVHTVYASTSGRRMDADKGPKERSVYPALCWAVDDYADAFRTVIVRPGQTVCAELVAAWSSSTVVDEFCTDDRDDDGCEHINDVDDDDRKKCTPVKIQQKQNRAVLFSGAVPYAAVRATYECKMSLYREAERQRRKRQKCRGGKKSSLGAALSASLTALFAGGKETAADYGEYDCVYEANSATASERIEYVTVRGCRLRRDVEESQWFSDDQNNYDFDDACSANSNAYDNTKGLAQMAVALAPVQTTEASAIQVFDGVDVGQDCDYGDVGYDCDSDFDGSETDADDGYRGRQQRPHQQQFVPPSSYTTSEPGDFYDYGWDYETANASEQQTPQTPSYHYQQQQQMQLEWQRRRGGRPRRLSDPCSKSAYDLLDDDDELPQRHLPLTPNQQPLSATGNLCGRSTGRRKTAHGHYYNNDDHRYGRRWRPSNGGGGSSTASTPGISGNVQHPHRAWSESDGLDRCGGGWPYSGVVPLHQQQQQRKRQTPLPPPPVPYYCAAEAAASGFVQHLHKSPGGWRAKTRARRRMKKSSGKASKNEKTSDSSRRRSASDGGNRHAGGCDGSNSENGDSGSDSDQMDDSDGEFIGALAAAAVAGHDPDREWMQRNSDGDPTADWDRYESSDSDSAAVAADDGNAIEWTAEIVASDLRHGRASRHIDRTGYGLPSRMSSLPQDDFTYHNRQPPPTSTPVTANQNQSQKLFGLVGRQQQRCRRPPIPQFRSRPLELPPMPPALSVAITAVACPWWTVLDDVLLVSVGVQSSTRKTAVGLPLLTFD